jgi:CxxC-x17-CxxC domain-containing protein
MDFSDRVLKCVVCGKEFIFTADEQRFFHAKNFVNDPKHCKECKAKRAASASRTRPETRTVCAECGLETTVPFRPNQGRPVLCRACFEKQAVWMLSQSGSSAIWTGRFPHPLPHALRKNIFRIGLYRSLEA